MGIRRRVYSFAIALTVALVLCGCGESESSKPTPAAANPDQPMAGKAPSGAGQFVGKWFATSEGVYESMEFMKDGQVLVIDVLSKAAMGMGKTLKYSVLEGGRLSMIAPDGLTAIYDVTLNGDVMELRGEMVLSDNGMQRFQKLKPGETIEQKRKEMVEARTKEYRERTAATEAFFKQKGLVLVYGTGSGINAAVVADTTFAGGFNGKAWSDAPQPYQHQISGQLVPNEREQKLQVRINMGPEIAPNKGRPGTGNATLDITGTGSNMKVAGKVQFGNSGTPMDLTLKVDQAMHDRIVKRFDEQLVKLEAAKKPLIDALKDFAIISGKSGNSNPALPDTEDKIILVKTDQPGVWRGEGSVTSQQANASNTAPIAGPITATVETGNDNKPMLMIKSPLREYQLTLSSAGGNKLEGGHFYPGNPRGFGVEFTIVSYDQATRQKMVNDQKKALTSLAGPAPYAGTYIARPSGFSPYIPVSLTLSSGANGALTGTMKYPMHNAVLNVQGQIAESLAGPQLLLSFTPANQASQQIAANMRQPMSIAVEDNTEGLLKLTASNPTTGVFTLARIDDAWRAKHKKALTDTLAKGMKFRSVFPYPDQPQFSILDMKIDPATSKITGTVPQARPGIFQTNSTIIGELKEEDGLLILATEIQDPQVGNRFRATYITNLYMHLSPKGWIGVAITYPSHATGSRGPLDIIELKE